MDAGIHINEMAPPPELTNKLSDIDAHPSCIFPAHLSQGTTVNAQHRDLQFTAPIRTPPLPVRHLVLQSSFRSFKRYLASVESNFLASQAIFVIFSSLQEVKFTPSSFDTVFEA